MEAQAPAPKQQQPAPKQQPQPQVQAPKPAQIDRNGVLILIRSTLLALDQANKTGNYTVLRDLGSPNFQANSAARLAEIFAQQRKDNVDLSGIAVIDPQLTLTLQRKRTGGSQHVTVKHIHQQVHVTEGGQAVVAGEKLTTGTRGRSGSDGGGMAENEQ
jgi:hypothetical protein